MSAKQFGHSVAVADRVHRGYDAGGEQVWEGAGGGVGGAFGIDAQALASSDRTLRSPPRSVTPLLEGPVAARKWALR